MASNKVWNLKYYFGNTKRIITSAGSPMSKKDAMDGYEVINGNGWSVWIEHYLTREKLMSNVEDKP